MKIKNNLTEQIFFFSTYNEALRTLPDRRGLPMLTGKRYKTIKQAEAILSANAYEIMNDDHTPYVPQDDNVKFQPEPEPTKPDADVMTQFTAAIAKMIHVEDKIQKIVSEQVGNMQDDIEETVVEKMGELRDELHTVVESLVANAKPKTLEVVIVPQEGPKKNMGVQHFKFEKLLKVIGTRESVFLVGPAGSGKTSAAEKVAEALELEFRSISVGAQTTETKFFGYMWGGEYVRSLFREAFEFGGVFLIDEIDAGNSNVLTSINQALANGVCAFPDGMVKKHPDFVCVAGGNTYGSGANREYVGRNQLDAATLDRFVFMDWPYDEAFEDSLVENKEWLHFVWKCRKFVAERKIRAVVSPRASLTGTKLLKAGLEWDEVVEMVIYKGMNETEKQLLKNNC